MIGAPQYFLGDYLNIDKHLPLLEGIMGSTSSEAVQRLNAVMQDCIYSDIQQKPKVYIHYSPKEHTYAEHIAHMIMDLERCGYEIIEDAEYEYTDHGEVAKCFPQYLSSILTEYVDS